LIELAARKQHHRLVAWTMTTGGYGDYNDYDYDYDDGRSASCRSALELSGMNIDYLGRY